MSPLKKSQLIKTNKNLLNFVTPFSVKMVPFTKFYFMKMNSHAPFLQHKVQVHTNSLKYNLSAVSRNYDPHKLLIWKLVLT